MVSITTKNQKYCYTGFKVKLSLLKHIYILFTMIWSILILLIVLLSYLTKIKIEYCKLRNHSKKIEVEVVEYRKENGGMKNEQKSLNYPYVRIKTEKNEYSIVKLQFANNFKKPFKIGEKIFVFLYLGDLLYWNAYDNGIYKYLPESWKITK